MKKAFHLLTLAALLAVAFMLAPGRAPDAVRATHAMPCYDLNGDGEVNMSDITIVISWFGQAAPSPAPAAVDVNSDGTVDLFGDILPVIAAFGTTTGCQDTPVHGKGSFLSVGDDKFPSLGKFRILVAPAFRSLMALYPGYDGVSRLESPVLNDANTVVGRSAAHTHGSGTDTGGASVGTAGTSISDSDFSLEPAGFQGSVGTREVHTEIVELNLTAGAVAVRAGTDAPSRPISPGEVQAWNPSGNSADDWPADSFFNVFVEVDLPAIASFPGGTLYNAETLLIQNTKLESFPPTVIYIHGNSSAVPILFKTTNPGFWQADDLFGHLILAGHGANFGETAPAGTTLFETALDAIEAEQGEMPLPKLPFPGDSDGDGCADVSENRPKAELANGGGRDWLNPWDYYDVNGDGFINLFDDIIGVIQHFSLDGLGQYDVIYDRGPDAGPNPWNMTAPDGQINLFDDIIGVIQQFTLDGCIDPGP